MLNPESIVVYRNSGIGSPHLVGSAISGREQCIDTLLYDGNGTTIIDLQLLFDVTLPDAPSGIENVRDLTTTLFDMTKPIDNDTGGRNIPRVRIIWGKNWSVSGVVMALSERLDYFSSEGVPRRSWVTLRFQVVDDSLDNQETIENSQKEKLLAPESLQAIQKSASNAEVLDSCNTMAFTDRLDVIAQKKYGAPQLWKVIAEFNNLDSVNPREDQPFIKLPPMEEMVKENG